MSFYGLSEAPNVSQKDQQDWNFHGLLVYLQGTARLMNEFYNSYPARETRWSSPGV